MSSGLPTLPAGMEDVIFFIKSVSSNAASFRGVYTAPGATLLMVTP